MEIVFGFQEDESDGSTVSPIDVPLTSLSFASVTAELSCDGTRFSESHFSGQIYKGLNRQRMTFSGGPWNFYHYPGEFSHNFAFELTIPVSGSGTRVVFPLVESVTGSNAADFIYDFTVFWGDESYQGISNHPSRSHSQY